MRIDNVQIDILDKIVETLRLNGHDVFVNIETRTLDNDGIIGDALR